MTIREYSKRLGNTSNEPLQDALRDFDLGEFLSATPISFGLFGQNLFVASTAGEVDEFVRSDLRNKVIQPGFAERPQGYRLYDSLIIWSFRPGHLGGLPEDETLTLEQWVGPFAAYWEKYKI